MKAKELQDIDVEEISLVDLPAIRTKFVIIKDGKSFGKKQDDFQNSKKEKEVKKMDELVKILKKITGAELSEKQTEALKALSDDERKELSKSLGVIEEYKEELPKELNETLSELTKFAVREQEVPKITKEQKDEIIKEFDKSGKKLSKDTLDVITSVVKKLGSIVEVVDALTNLLPEGTVKKVKKTEKEEEEEDKFEKFEKEYGEKVEKVLGDAKTAMDKKLAEKDAEIEKLEKRLKTVEETKGVKKGLEEEEEEEEDKDKIKKEKVLWPSFLSSDEE
jgi:hypothetical protein